MRPANRPIRLLFWAAAVFTFVMAVLPHPPDLPGHPSDKVQHVVAFATLAALAAVAFPTARLWSILAGLSVFGAVIEIVQAIRPLNRDSDPRDWMADTIAAALVLLLAWLRVRFRRK